MLKDIGRLKTEYSSDVDDIAREFYDPCLSNSMIYDRITGFFSSTIFYLVHESIGKFVLENNGHFRFLCSPRISERDAEGILFGYDARSDADLSAALTLEMREMLASESHADSARLLATLIASKQMEIRFAMVGESIESPMRRMFHDKVGLFEDANGDRVGFRGSANETYLGVSSHGNIESIDVWPSWEKGRDLERVANARERFDNLWDGRTDGVRIVSLPEEFTHELELAASGLELEQLVGRIRNRATQEIPDRYQVGDVVLRAHQSRAISKWGDNDHRGILSHATGSGKTVTGLFAAQMAISQGLVPVILVPSKLLLEQWASQLRVTLGARVIVAGAGHTTWRSSGNVRAALESGDPSRPYAVVAVLNTASTEAFRSQVGPMTSKVFVIVDEVHRVGSPLFSEMLNWIDSPWRLGLSATPERANDPVGTAALMSYCGGIIDRYTLKDALDDGVLTPYRYEPTWVELQDQELEAWEKLSQEIQQLFAIAQTPKASDQSRERLRRKLIERARIAKGAANKIPRAVELLEKHFRPSTGQKWLVYCDNQTQLAQVREALSHKGIASWEYHSEMKGDAAATLNLFDMNGGIIVAIKCLDEGVDIPSATHALVIASSRNPREFIQRRGRILRRSPAKTIANLIDVLVLPTVLSKDDPTWSLAIGELARARQFADWAVTKESVSAIEDKWVSMGLELGDFDELQEAGAEGDDDA